MSDRYHVTISLISAFLLCLVFVRSMTQRRMLTTLREKYLFLRRQDSEQQEELSLLRKNRAQESEFKENLRNAELTTSLQQSRLHNQQTTNICDPPERYNYILAMKENGLEADQIAGLLSISVQEARQLTRLADLAHTG
ncbi:MAG: hypothetical protein ABFS19_06130 [Thermodesulfobacteriota bacterium]